MNPLQTLMNWLNGNPSLPNITPRVVITIFIYHSDVQPVLPQAGSGQPNPNVQFAAFTGEAQLTNDDPDALFASASLYYFANDSTLPFAAITFSGFLHGDEQGIQVDPDQVIFNSPAYASLIDYNRYPDFSRADFRPWNGLAFSDGGSEVWVLYQLLGVNEEDPSAPIETTYWCAIYLTMSGSPGIAIHRIPPVIGHLRE
jgi:hypothetical protein